jgi:hypothetical protein
MDVLEDPSGKLLWVTTEKRDKRIKVFIPEFNNFSFWYIKYEDGTEVPELTGAWLTKREAVKALEFWEQETKVSKTKYRKDLWGDKEPPELKRKKVKVAPTDSTEAG